MTSKTLWTETSRRPVGCDGCDDMFSPGDLDSDDLCVECAASRAPCCDDYHCPCGNDSTDPT